MYLDKDGNAQTNLSQNGHLAAGVPGTISAIRFHEICKTAL
jgi:gamma-glutamyltranspeptidase/glutathione hydrolase